MTSRSGSRSSSPASREDQLRASSERLGELRRFAQVSQYGLAAWLLFSAVSLTLARVVYGVPIWIIFATRAIGAVVIVAGGTYARRAQQPSSLALTLTSGGVCCASAALIGFEGAYLGGATSPYATGAAFALVALAVLQRRAHDTWPAFILCGLSYGVGLAVAPIGVLAHLAPGEGYVFATQLVLLVGLSLFCLLLSHHAWAVRRELFQSRSIGRYRLQHRLGRGGMGEVWAAFHTTLGRDVAVKILRPERTDEAAVQRFEREVRATTALTHPNTVRVFDYGVTEDGLWYYAMELLEGVSLSQLVAAEGTQPQARAVHLVAQAARALGEAHRSGIVHRDVKPENLVITTAGGEPDFLKVIDFGIARSAADATVTAIGEVAGTPSYMSPELTAGEVADARTDVYALGAVLYFLLTGTPPFVAADSAAVMHAHRYDPVVPPSLRMQVPIDAGVEALVLACLAKSPADRFADGAAVAEALAATAVFGAWNPAAAAARTLRGATVDGSHEPTVDDLPSSSRTAP
jgi:serine/threonine-protein kinase